MSNCINTVPTKVCFSPNDSNLDSVTIFQHTIYEQWKPVGQSYTTIQDTETALDLSVFLGWWELCNESAVIRTEEQKLTVTPWGLSVQGVAVTTPPVATVGSITLTKEAGNFVEVSFDGGGTYPLRVNRNGTRTWSNDSDNLDVSPMRFRWGNANTDYDLIWENL